EIIWFCHGVGHDKGDLAYSSPVIHDGICFLTGGFRGPALAVRLGGSGDVTETHRLWRQEKQPQSIGSGVVIDGFVYRPNAGPGTLQCINIKTGESLWEERAPGTMWASVVLAGGLLYATNQDAMTTVFKPNPSAWEEVARNKLPGSTNSTPAIAGGHVFVRTNEALWCLGKK
ncbi:MAG: PQQ-binding-like beta-propeller repeat protein, partial [Planctomycetaceae bacterium]|nr:PQQ-binding-like beta-propeller repeat protein [Planctomycetaceae bacterium]